MIYFPQPQKNRQICCHDRGYVINTLTNFSCTPVGQLQLSPSWSFKGVGRCRHRSKQLYHALAVRISISYTCKPIQKIEPTYDFRKFIRMYDVGQNGSARLHDDDGDDDDDDDEMGLYLIRCCFEAKGQVSQLSWVFRGHLEFAQRFALVEAPWGLIIKGAPIPRKPTLLPLVYSKPKRKNLGSMDFLCRRTSPTDQRLETGPTPMRCFWNANLLVDPFLGVWGTQRFVPWECFFHMTFLMGETRKRLKWTNPIWVGELVAKCVPWLLLLSWWSAKTKKRNKSVQTLVRVTKCKILFPFHRHHGAWIVSQSFPILSTISVVVSIIFYDFLFSALPGEMLKFDEHIFQMGGSTTN